MRIFAACGGTCGGRPGLSCGGQSGPGDNITTINFMPCDSDQIRRLHSCYPGDYEGMPCDYGGGASSEGEVSGWCSYLAEGFLCASCGGEGGAGGAGGCMDPGASNYDPGAG